MCNFKSAIVIRDEKVKHGFRLLLSPWTESHSELCQIFKLRDGAHLDFAQVEFSPDSIETAYKLDTYKLNLDEERTPDWYTDEVAEEVQVQLTEYIRPQPETRQAHAPFWGGREVSKYDPVKEAARHAC